MRGSVSASCRVDGSVTFTGVRRATTLSLTPATVGGSRTCQAAYYGVSRHQKPPDTAVTAPFVRPTTRVV